MTILHDLPGQPGQYDLIHNDVYAENFLYANGEVQLFDFDQSCHGWYLQDLLNPIYPHHVFPAVKIPDATTEDLAYFFTHVVAGYRGEHTLAATQLAMANALLQLKEIFVYLILNTQLAQWASTLGLTVEQPRVSVTTMEHRVLTGTAVVELDCRSFCTL